MGQTTPPFGSIEEGVRVFDTMPLEKTCRCSAERVEGILATMSDEDIKDVTVDGVIAVVDGAALAAGQVASDMDNESLLVHACESLASANIMTSDIAAYVDSPQRQTILAIQQIIMLAELAVNRVLDNVEISQSAAHS